MLEILDGNPSPLIIKRFFYEKRRMTTKSLLATVVGGIATFVAYDYFVKPYLDTKFNQGETNNA